MSDSVNSCVNLRHTAAFVWPTEATTTTTATAPCRSPDDRRLFGGMRNSSSSNRCFVFFPFSVSSVRWSRRHRSTGSRSSRPGNAASVTPPASGSPRRTPPRRPPTEIHRTLPRYSTVMQYGTSGCRDDVDPGDGTSGRRRIRPSTWHSALFRNSRSRHDGMCLQSVEGPLRALTRCCIADERRAAEWERDREEKRGRWGNQGLGASDKISNPIQGDIWNDRPTEVHIHDLVLWTSLYFAVGQSVDKTRRHRFLPHRHKTQHAPDHSCFLSVYHI